MSEYSDGNYDEEIDQDGIVHDYEGMCEYIQLMCYYNYLATIETFHVLDEISPEEQEQMKYDMIASLMAEEDQPEVELLNEIFVPMEKIDECLKECVEIFDEEDDLFLLTSKKLEESVASITRNKIFEDLNHLVDQGHGELCWDAERADFVFRPLEE